MDADRTGVGQRPLTWWGSVRIAGWRGGRAASLDLQDAMLALRRGLRGHRRVEFVQNRLAVLLTEWTASYRSGGASSALAARALAEQLLWIPSQGGVTDELASAVAGLMKQVASGRLLEQAISWFAGHEVLSSELRAASLERVQAFVDVEVGPSGRIDDVAVVLEGAGRGRLLEAEWDASSFEPSVVSELLTGCIVVAHNGESHDFPVLERSGVIVPDQRCDTLRWAQVSAPSLPSHSLQALLDRWVVGRREGAHTALVDAQNLALLYRELRRRLRALPARHRGGLSGALQTVVASAVLDDMLDTGSISNWIPASAPRVPEQRAPISDGSAVRHVHEGGPHLIDRAVLMLHRLSDVHRWCLPLSDLTWRVGGVSCLDGDVLAANHRGAGWPAAVGVSLLETTGGVVEVAPLPVQESVASLARRTETVLEVGDGSTLVTDHATLSVAPPAGPVTVADVTDLFRWPDASRRIDSGEFLQSLAEDGVTAVAVAQLPEPELHRLYDELGEGFDIDPIVLRAGRIRREDGGGWMWGPAPFDPAQYAGELHVCGRGITWDRPELRTLWPRLLGSQPSFHGSLEASDVEVVIVADPPPQGAGNVAVACRWAVHLLASVRQSGTAIYLGAPDRQEQLPSALPGRWRQLYGGEALLRPPSWPTVTEAGLRVQRAPHAVLATWQGGRSLLESDPPATGPVTVVVDRLPRPDPQHPVVARLLREAADPFADVVEPLAALQLFTIVTTHADRVVLMDRVALWSPLLAAFGPFVRSWEERELEDVSRHPYVREIDMLFDAAVAPPPLLFDPDALRTAFRRLLRPEDDPQPFQQAIIEDLRTGRDVLGVFRTGAGKSLCYQAPALAAAASTDAVTIVVSPLRALQRTQLVALQARGVWEATVINSDLDSGVRSARLRGLRAGFYRIVYCAPEALVSRSLTDVLRALPVRLLAVDEAHVISEMGHEFRPDYRILPAVLRRLVGRPVDASLPPTGRPQVLALTGTASPAVQDDVTGLFELPFRQHVDDTFVRDELRFALWNLEDDPAQGPFGWRCEATVVSDQDDVAGDDERWRALACCLDNVGRPAIVYAPTRVKVEQLARSLRHARADDAVAHYHAGIDAAGQARRAEVEQRFLDGQIDVLVATNAFGMGVDKGDVRAVIHWGMPATPEALYQEAGRAGRQLPDGEIGRCIVLYRPGDLELTARLQRRGRATYQDLQQTWATLEGIAASGVSRPDGGRDVLITDDDLAALAGLPDDVDPRLVIAFLERVGLVREIDRFAALALISRTHSPPTNMVSPAERALLDRLPQPGTSAPVDLTQLAGRINGREPVSLREVRLVLQGLQRCGLITLEQRVGVTRMVSDPAAEALDRWTQIKRVGDALNGQPGFKEGRWVGVRPGQSGVEPEHFFRALEVLAAEGCVRLKGGFKDANAVRMRREQPFGPQLRAIREQLEPVAGRLTGQQPSYSLTALAGDIGTDPGTVRRVLVTLHLLDVIALDPAGWQFNGASDRRTILARLVRLFDHSAEDTEAALRQAERLIDERRRDEHLKRLALQRYVPLPDEDDVLSRQQFLGDYLTDPSFLDDLLASETATLTTGLDEDQLAAVRSDAATLRLVAGPGTGKTHTLTRRIAYHAKRASLAPHATLAVSFTKDAAAQMGARLAALDVTGVRSETLHRVALRLVRADHRWLGYQTEPDVIADDSERAKLLPPDWRRQQKQALDIIDVAAAYRLGPDQMASAWAGLNAPLPFDKAFPGLVSAYRTNLTSLGKIDFPHAIMYACRLLDDEQRSPIARRGLRHVFLDEAQDVNRAEMDLVLGLAQQSTLLVVGDERQAIYEWKNASPTMMNRYLQERRSEVKQLELTHSYRSRPEIISAVNAVGERIAPQLRPLATSQPAGGQIEQLPAKGEKESRAHVAERVGDLLADGIADSEIAVLARGGKSVSALYQSLRRAGIHARAAGLRPLRLTAAFQLLPAAEVPSDDEDLAVELETYLRSQEVEQRLTTVDATRTEANFDDRDRLIDAIHVAVEDGATNLEDITRGIASKDQTGDGTGVVVSTIHKAKGLEWDVVLVADMDTASWYAKTPRQKKEMERLFYVAISRARHRLELHRDSTQDPYSLIQLVSDG